MPDQNENMQKSNEEPREDQRRRAELSPETPEFGPPPGENEGMPDGDFPEMEFPDMEFPFIPGEIRIIRCRPRRFRRCRRPAVEMEGDQTARIDRTDREDFLGDSGRRSRCIRFRSSREIYREAQTTVPLIVPSVF